MPRFFSKQQKLHDKQQTRPRFAALLVALVLMGGTQTVSAQPANGLENPTLSLNLAGANDFSAGFQFIDLMKMMRPWIGHEAKNGWGGMNEAELRAGGFLDADGWVEAIPPGFDRVGTLWEWSSMRDDAGTGHAGTYVLTYDGQGEINLRGSARVLGASRGRINFINEDAGTFIMDIVRTDPNGTGDYIRNISIVAERHMDLHQAGAIFNPAWLETIADARELRFMDWMHTNGSTVTSWDDMPSVNGPASRRGMPVEHMVRLANEVGADPWFTMPHLADDTYIRNFATYVRDNLDPGLTARVEYTNEAWNFAFSQTHWLRDQASAAWGEEAYVDYHAKKAVETALIWEDVYGDEADSGRLTNVLGAFVANTWLNNRLLKAPVWRENEPDAFVDPKSVFEEIAIATYFGVPTMGNAEMRAELIAKVNDPHVDAQAWLAERLLDPDYNGSVPQIAELIAQSSQIAADNGLRLVTYEGGQHVHHSFAVASMTEQDLAALNAFMKDFIRGPHMATLYQALWDTWKMHGHGAFMQFTDIGGSSRWGTWGLRNSLTDSNPRADLLVALNAATTPWWDGAKGGAFRQQGVTTWGSPDADMLVGTDQEDYLMGGRGDDTFAGGLGDDGINGGPGFDRVELAGDPSQYTMRVDGDGYRLNGPEGSDFIIHVDALTFADGQQIGMDELQIDPGGAVVWPAVVE